jgi:hypothetical protein
VAFSSGRARKFISIRDGGSGFGTKALQPSMVGTRTPLGEALKSSGFIGG